VSDLWATPQALFDKLHAEFSFYLDVCALPENAKCEWFFTPERDGLQQVWRVNEGRSIWMNPPYGREIERWMKKAYETSLEGHCVVCLIPNRSNAPWWHEYVMKAAEIRFIKHKVSFEGSAEGVPFWGSVIAVFNGQNNAQPLVSTYLQPQHEEISA
jgi:site-specific DNA-methyltransferase (adenine-specific)